MKKNVKILDFFRVILIIIIVSIISLLIGVRKVNLTNEMNISVVEQVEFVNQYKSDSLASSELKKFINEYIDYISDKQSQPFKIPTIEFYGAENNNLMLLYTVDDSAQFDYYINELKKLENKINENDLFYFTYEMGKEYITKIIIEYNY